jgi:hypothetical protein
MGSLKGRVPLLSLAWLLGCEWWALLVGPAHERMNARSCRVWAGLGVGRRHLVSEPGWPMPALGGFPRGVGCQGPVVSASALVPHRLAKGAVGNLKGRVPLLSLVWLLGCEWWTLSAEPAHERMNARSYGLGGGWTLTNHHSHGKRNPTERQQALACRQDRAVTAQRLQPQDTSVTIEPSKACPTNPSSASLDSYFSLS